MVAKQRLKAISYLKQGFLRWLPAWNSFPCLQDCRQYAAGTAGEKQ